MEPLSLSNPSPTASASTDARGRLIQAAFRLFGRQGYARTSVQDIAKAAQVKKPVLYYYFQNKEGLYRALVEQSTVMFRHFLLEAASAAGVPGESAAARLERLAETMLGLARDNRDPVRFFFAHIFAADEDRPLCDTTDFEQTPPRILRRIVEEGVRRGELSGQAEDLERLLVGAIQLSILKHLRHPKEEPLAPGLGRRIVQAAIQGFAVRSP